MSEVRVLLRDTATGAEGWHVSDVEERYVDSQEFWWTEGNGSCDCNRGMFLADSITGDADVDDFPCGDGRYVIMAATVDGVPQDWSK